VSKRCHLAWIAVGLIGLVSGIFVFAPSGALDIFRGKTPRDWAVELSYGTDQKQRDDAALALQRLGSNAVPALVAMFGAEPAFYQPVLVKFAFRLPEKQQDALLRSVKLVDAAGLRLSAARALAALGSEARTAIPDLSGMIYDSDSRVSFAAMRALGKIGPDALPILTNTLHDPDPELRRQAALALGVMGTNAADTVSLLARRLNDPSDLVAAAASQTLRHFRQLGVPSLNYSTTTAQQIALREQTEMRRGILPALYDFAWQQRDPQVVPVLTAHLNDPDAALRQWAAHALGKMGSCSSNTVPLLTSLLSDREQSVRVAATNALIEIRRALDSATPFAELRA
jgi:HEAT repeat protein